MIEFAPVRCLLFMAAAVYEAWLPWPTARISLWVWDRVFDFTCTGKRNLGGDLIYLEVAP